MNVKVETLVEVIQRNAATGEIVSRQKPQKNLVMDGGLNALARSTNATYPADMTVACRVRSGSTADKVGSGAITFTQAGITITASGGFFTAGMVGWIFKYGSGTGGAEYYITGYTSATQVTVDTSATVAVPTVATVWNVTRTTLETLLYTYSTYETTAGSCGTTFSGNTAAHKRTYNFAQQAVSYNVNEVGYFRASAGTGIFGRVVLAATEVVAPTNFLQIVLTVTFTYSPNVPTAVIDVGTNINTAGNAAIEGLYAQNMAIVASTGGPVPATGSAASLDGSNSGGICGITANYSQNATPSNTTGVAATLLTFANPTWTYAGTRGKMTLTANTTISTAGQTLYGVCLRNGSNNTTSFDVKFTTTYVCPTGSFLPQVVFSCTYNRNLSN